jgi:hypothetical protein
MLLFIKMTAQGGYYSFIKPLIPAQQKHYTVQVASSCLKSGGVRKNKCKESCINSSAAKGISYKAGDDKLDDRSYVQAK